MSAAVGQSGPAATIEPELLQRLQADGRADFSVKMAAEADLTAAATMDWQSRGAYVWNALNQVAGSTQAPVLEAAREMGLQVYPSVAANAVYVRGGDLAEARRLAALPGVAYLRFQRVYPLPATPESAAGRVATSPEGSITWNVADTKADQVWAFGVRGQGIKVAEIDSGVQWDHPALIDNYGCVEDPGNPQCWLDPTGGCPTPCDPDGRGTFIMGIMAAKDDPSFDHIAGMAPDATWIACRGCSSGGCSEETLVACAEWVLAPAGDPANRPQVVNNSWGGMGGDAWFLPYVQAWRAAGILPVFGGLGNGPGCATLSSPADYQEVLGLAAHDTSRNAATFSARGPSFFGDDPYTKPNLSGPGVNLCSTYPPDGWNCGYSGMSFPAPHAAGAVALAWSACPDLVGQIDATFELLQDNADPPPAGNCGAPPDGEGNYTYGYGYLDALAAVQACMPEGSLHINKMKMTWAPAVRPGRYKVTTTARIQDETHLAAPGATVLGDYTYPDGTVHSLSAVTNLRGVAKFRVKTSLTGVYSFCVTDITKAGYLYDPDANEDGPCKSVSVTP